MDPTRPQTDNSPFYLAYFLTTFTSPLIGALPLCFADRDARYRGLYLRGMGFSFFTYTALFLALAVVLATQCQSEAPNGIATLTDGYGNVVFQYYVDCNFYYTRLLPAAAFWLIMGGIALRRGTAYLQSASGYPAAMTGVWVYNSPAPSQPNPTQPYSAPPYTAQPYPTQPYPTQQYQGQQTQESYAPPPAYVPGNNVGMQPLGPTVMGTQPIYAQPSFPPPKE
ncbi:hypothetical protein BC830DRAFT_1175879 [Chytriomyces sp. MP71]|nr:hypothetical protein BC830DRAFT_1175879 [Chytriomyces sp. MP71]